jgi:sugar phosphate isomerase/epimerase
MRPMSSRRDFLTSGVLAVPALSLVDTPIAIAATPAQGAGGGRRPLKLGIVTYNIAKDWDVPTIITHLTEVGIDGVELRTTHAHGVEPSLTPVQRAEVRKQFEGSAVKIGGLGTICEYHAEDAAVVRKNVEETKVWLRLARDLGCPSIKVRPNGLRKDVPEERTLEQIGKALAECGRAAADEGVRIQVEVHGRDTTRIPRMKKILDHAGDHPTVWILCGMFRAYQGLVQPALRA